MAKFVQKHISQIALLGVEYTPATLEPFSEKTLRKEYSRMRSIAVKRLKSFERAGTQSASYYQEYKIENPFLTLKELEKQKVNENSDMKRVLKFELSRLYQALASSTSSNAKYQEYKEKRIARLENIGIDFIHSQEDFAIWEKLTKELYEMGLGWLIYEETVRKAGKYNRTYKSVALTGAESVERLFQLYKQKGVDGIDEYVSNTQWNY